MIRFIFIIGLVIALFSSLLKFTPMIFDLHIDSSILWFLGMLYHLDLFVHVDVIVYCLRIIGNTIIAGVVFDIFYFTFRLFKE